MRYPLQCNQKSSCFLRLHMYINYLRLVRLAKKHYTACAINVATSYKSESCISQVQNRLSSESGEGYPLILDHLTFVIMNIIIIYMFVINVWVTLLLSFSSQNDCCQTGRQKIALLQVMPSDRCLYQLFVH